MISWVWDDTGQQRLAKAPEGTASETQCFGAIERLVHGRGACWETLLGQDARRSLGTAARGSGPPLGPPSFPLCHTRLLSNKAFRNQSAFQGAPSCLSSSLFSLSSCRGGQSSHQMSLIIFWGLEAHWTVLLIRGLSHPQPGWVAIVLFLTYHRKIRLSVTTETPFESPGSQRMGCFYFFIYPPDSRMSCFLSCHTASFSSKNQL